MFKFLKKFRAKPAKPAKGGEVQIIPLPQEGRLTSMVTRRGPEVVVAFDMEGGQWEFTRAGDIVYVQGEDGTVQIQYHVDVIEDLIDELDELIL